MEYILIYQMCSILNNFCYPPLTDREALDTWSKCVAKGSEKVIELVERSPKEFDDNKYMVKYWCISENKFNKTPVKS
jgi:hypothetical protein